MLLFCQMFMQNMVRWHEFCMIPGEKGFFNRRKGSFKMRTPVSLGLLALSLAFFASTAVAGNVEQCEFLKNKSDPVYSPGLYGLCIAYTSADSENARLRISDNYDARNQNNAPSLEQIFAEASRQAFSCICWNSLAFTAACTLANDASMALPGESALTLLDFENQMMTAFGADADSCALLTQDLSTSPPTEHLVEEPTAGVDAELCMAELAVIGSMRDNADLCAL